MNYKPMLCKIGNKNILKNKSYIFEPKLDGTRVLVYIDRKNKKIKLINRRERDIAYRYPELKKIWKLIKTNCVLDAELVVFNENGLPDFNLLQQREQLENKLLIQIKAKQIPACLVVFDVLEIEGKPILNLSLTERKKKLDFLIEKETNKLKKITWMENGIELWKIIKKLNLEGIIAKFKNSFYLQERSSYWLKIKNYKSIDALIIGYTHEKRIISALALGLWKNKDLFYIGRVAAGLDAKLIDLLSNLLKPIKNLKVVNLKTSKEIKWVKPEIVAEVRYLEITKDYELRAPVLLRLRFDKKPDDCKFENLI